MDASNPDRVEGCFANPYRCERDGPDEGGRAVGTAALSLLVGTGAVAAVLAGSGAAYADEGGDPPGGGFGFTSVPDLAAASPSSPVTVFPTGPVSLAPVTEPVLASPPSIPLPAAPVVPAPVAPPPDAPPPVAPPPVASPPAASPPVAVATPDGAALTSGGSGAGTPDQAAPSDGGQQPAASATAEPGPQAITAGPAATVGPPARADAPAEPHGVHAPDGSVPAAADAQAPAGGFSPDANLSVDSSVRLTPLDAGKASDSDSTDPATGNGSAFVNGDAAGAQVQVDPAVQLTPFPRTAGDATPAPAQADTPAAAAPGSADAPGVTAASADALVAAPSGPADASGATAPGSGAVDPAAGNAGALHDGEPGAQFHLDPSVQLTPFPGTAADAPSAGAPAAAATATADAAANGPVPSPALAEGTPGPAGAASRLAVDPSVQVTPPDTGKAPDSGQADPTTGYASAFLNGESAGSQFHLDPSVRLTPFPGTAADATAPADGTSGPGAAGEASHLTVDPSVRLTPLDGGSGPDGEASGTQYQVDPSVQLTPFPVPPAQPRPAPSGDGTVVAAGGPSVDPTPADGTSGPLTTGGTSGAGTADTAAPQPAPDSSVTLVSPVRTGPTATPPSGATAAAATTHPETGAATPADKGSQGGSSPFAYAGAGVVPGFGLGTLFRYQKDGNLATAAAGAATRIVPSFVQDAAQVGGVLTNVPLTGDKQTDAFLHQQIVDPAVVTGVDMALRKVNPLIQAAGEGRTFPGSVLLKNASLDSALPWWALTGLSASIPATNRVIDEVERNAGFATDKDGAPQPTTQGQYYGDLAARATAVGGNVGVWANAGILHPDLPGTVVRKVVDGASGLASRASDALQGLRPGSSTPGGGTDTAGTAPAEQAVSAGAPGRGSPAVGSAPSSAPTGAATPAEPRPGAGSAAGEVAAAEEASTLATAEALPATGVGPGAAVKLLLPFAVPWAQYAITQRVTHPAPQRDRVDDAIDAVKTTVVDPLTRTLGSDTVGQTAQVLGDTAIGCAAGVGTKGGCALGAAATGISSFRDKTTVGRNLTTDVRHADGTVGDAVKDNGLIVVDQAANVANAASDGLVAGLSLLSVPGEAARELVVDGRLTPGYSLQDRLQTLSDEPSMQGARKAAADWAGDVTRSISNARTMVTGTGAATYNLLRYGNTVGPVPHGHPYCADASATNCIEPGSISGPNSAGVLRTGAKVVGPKLVGPKIVGPGKVGTLYVGDGSGTPQDQLVTNVNNLMTGRPIRDAVDQAAKNFQASPVGTILKGAAAVFR